MIQSVKSQYNGDLAFKSPLQNVCVLAAQPPSSVWRIYGAFDPVQSATVLDAHSDRRTFLASTKKNVEAATKLSTSKRRR